MHDRLVFHILKIYRLGKMTSLFPTNSISFHVTVVLALVFVKIHHPGVVFGIYNVHV